MDFPSYWRRGLYGGLQASALATAGWVVVLILQTVLANPRRILLSLIAGPLLHLCWDYGGSWVLGAGGEHEEGGRKGWKRLALWSLGVAGVLAVIERANEYLDAFLASVLMIFPAGVILTLAVLLFSHVWPELRRTPDALSEIFFRCLVAVPLSVLVAGAIAGVSIGLETILAGGEGGRFISLLWWWTPAAFGFLIAARRPILAPFLCVLLLIASGAFNTYRFKSEGSGATHPFQFGPKASRRIPAFPVLPQGGRGDRDIVDRATDWVWREFDPKNFLSAVSDPFIPLRFPFGLKKNKNRNPRSAAYPVKGAFSGSSNSSGRRGARVDAPRTYRPRRKTRFWRPLIRSLSRGISKARSWVFTKPITAPSADNCGGVCGR